MTQTVIGGGASSAAAARAAAEAAARPGRRLLAFVQRRTGLTRSGLLIIGLAIVAWGLGRVIAGRPLYLLAYTIVGLLVLCRVAFNRRPGIEATRAPPVARVTEGTAIDVGVTLSAAHSVSTVVIEEQLPPLLGQSARIAIAQLPAGESIEHSYGITGWRRGVYSLGPLVVHWGDPFGLTDRSAELCDRFDLIVHPTIEPLVDRALTRMWEDPPVRPPISRAWPTGSEFYGMR